VRSKVFCVLSALFFASCTFQSKTQQCQDASQCPSSQSCYHGFCVVPESTTPVAGSGVSGGSGAVSGGGEGGSAGQSGQSGSAGGAGAGGSSGEACSPAGTTQACTIASKADSDRAGGGCGAGTRTCTENGVWGSCVADSAQAPVETCNGIDDDCDGNPDEGVVEACYNDGFAGCEFVGATNTYSCKGICSPGTRRCVNGDWGNCEGGTYPASDRDLCESSGTDDNCDGVIDCKCTGSGVIDGECYTGATADLNEGTACRKGKQTCTDGVLGCTGEIKPTAETCADRGVDNDCDGDSTDVDGVGEPCDTSRRGVCREGRTACQGTGSAAQMVCTQVTQSSKEVCDGKDNDCDGTVDNVAAADLASDPKNCGRCTRECGNNATCVAGVCVPIDDDPDAGT